MTNFKSYKFEATGVANRDEMEDSISEINNCEFCNKNAFELILKEFSFAGDTNRVIGILDVSYGDGMEIHEKMLEMVNCEFCHGNVEYISLS